MPPERLKHLPNLLTAVRFAAAVPLVVALHHFDVGLAVLLLCIAAASDVLDGWLARRLKVCSTRGAYLDAAADFTLLFAAFTVLVLRGVYPAWLLVVIGAMFAQFIVTSWLKTPMYDPVGKYIGAMLYAALFALLLLPDLLVSYGLLAGITAWIAVSCLSRLLTFTGLLTKRRSHIST
jgi:CDP-diacylglycerol--glycerol-3-phosphate 3-phosphatidyltransferase/cardiolipin synthase